MFEMEIGVTLSYFPPVLGEDAGQRIGEVD